MNDDELLGRWARGSDPAQDPITPEEVRTRAETSSAPEPAGDLGGARRVRTLRLLAAAAVVVVVALAATLVLAGRDDGRGTDRVHSQDAAAGAGSGPGIWGRTWALTTIGLNRGLLDVPGAGTAAGPTLDLTEQDQVLFTGCNTGGGPGRERDGVLTVDGWASEDKACTGKDGDALMQLDEVMASVLEHGATIDLQGSTLVLTQMATTATFVDLTPTGPTSQEGMGTVRVRIEPTGRFIEGFEVGLRFETADGTVVASTLWSDFVESTGRTDIDAYYDSVLEQAVPAGVTTVRAEVAIGPAGPPTPPDLAGDLPCSVTVDLDPDQVADVEVRFDEPDGNCLQWVPTGPSTTTTAADGGLDPSTTTALPPVTTTTAPLATTTVVMPGLTIGTGYYVDVDRTCEAFELQGIWVLDEGDIASWPGEGELFEGGTFTLDSPTTGTFRGDAAGTKVATFRRLGPDESPACEPAGRN